MKLSFTSSPAILTAIFHSLYTSSVSSFSTSGEKQNAFIGNNFKSISAQQRGDIFALKASTLKEILNDRRNIFPNPELSKKLSALSFATYKVDIASDEAGDLKSANSVLAEDNRFPDLKIHDFFDSSVNTQGMVVSSDADKYIAAVFKGTMEKEDWLTNIKGVKTTYGPREADDEEDENGGLSWDDDVPKGVRVHRGFNNAYFADDLSERLGDQLKELAKKHPDYDILITGHSLGGALSLLCGAHTAKILPDRFIQVINFGAPRVGNPSAKKWMESLPNLSVWRYVYECDVVPRMPYINYDHVGHLMQLNGENKERSRAHYLQIGDSEYELIGPPGLEWDVVPDDWISNSVDDHSGYNTEIVNIDSMWEINKFEKAQNW
eukprot:CAMPEP_0197824934 /NCGR_PEP_ID=MMETSP1437-20131217/2118_1 /TAXON_ID=49252 ORGANISM="Eucampia antarctica, Strain CCMP1452" /NCGR_SAMPLE_ID=MMETSP1437 /ASSEMBLY_ACC=CAM_ASM_001096 /LENGTH=378 /DNA_ID=CAMNT_0043424755 /DNA_START=27 /DNA_END=1160 /DNA_ORIENTATION=+